MTDPYDSDVYRWWHHSGPTPELLAAIDDRWLQPRGTVADIGCGLGTELAELTARGWQAIGLDSSAPAVRKARALHPAVTFIHADVRALPLSDASIDAALDRGCYHYLGNDDRNRYARELARALRPGGRLLLRAVAPEPATTSPKPDSAPSSAPGGSTTCAPPTCQATQRSCPPC
ncbi:MAG TPA: class I SAM-dependent methyltransferase [Streptosporangiaceae bacterium]|nr:class I SAM-dependent methyltransferase [Streptosporangiaceae bacterium]